MAYAKKEEIGRIEKNGRGEYVIVSRVGEDEGIDARIFYTADNGEVLPTKKGLQLKSETAAEVVALMFRALDSAAKEDAFNAIKSIMDSDMEEGTE